MTVRYLTLVGLTFKLSILNELQYRVNLVAQLFQTALDLIVALGGLSIVYAQTSQLNGWTQPELITVVGVYFIIGGALNMVIQPSMARLMEDVHRGTLDFALLKPVETQILVSVRDVQIWKGVSIAAGVVLVVAGTAYSDQTPTLKQGLTFAGLLAAGLLIVYSFWLMLTTCAFWFTRVDNILALFQSVYEAGHYPVRIYPGWLQLTLTFLVPVAFAVTVPAEALLGRLTPAATLTTLLVAGLMLVTSRLFWRAGLRHYSGASS